MVYGQVLYLGESKTFYQKISTTYPFYVLSRLNIKVLDIFKFQIYGGNAHYKFTLGITYDKLIEQVKLKRIL